MPQWRRPVVAAAAGLAERNGPAQCAGAAGRAVATAGPAGVRASPDRRPRRYARTRPAWATTCAALRSSAVGGARAPVAGALEPDRARRAGLPARLRSACDRGRRLLIGRGAAGARNLSRPHRRDDRRADRPHDARRRLAAAVHRPPPRAPGLPGVGAGCRLRERRVLDEGGFEAMVALFDSTITFHAHYQQRHDVATLLDLLVLDGDNPRSLGWVTQTLRGRHRQAGRQRAGQAHRHCVDVPDPDTGRWKPCASATPMAATQRCWTCCSMHGLPRTTSRTTSARATSRTRARRAASVSVGA